MQSELWDTLEQLFLQASQLPPDQQHIFIEAASKGNKELETELSRLLKGHNKPSLLDTPVHSVVFRALAELEVGPPERIGPYKRLKKLGSGGMGVVYLAAHDDWDRRVAIKIPRDVWISPDRLEKFRSEQRLLAQLTHPGIAQILDGGTEGSGWPWFAMEFVDGVPITTYCRDSGLPVHLRLRLFLAVCDATQHAHSQLIVHRDLKPSNIFVTPAGEVKLLDFGIARQIRSDVDLSVLTSPGFHPLTIAYSAPEQIFSNEVSIKTDVYALGVVLYELLTDRLPFDIGGLNAVRAAETIRSTEPRKPSEISSRVPGSSGRRWAEIDLLVRKAMHGDPAQRYSTVEALSRDVRHFLADQPLEAYPDSAAYRAGKFFGRNRKTISIVAAALAVLVAFTAFFTVSLAEAHNAALEEVARTRRATQFTQSMLSGGDMERGPSKDMKITDMLDVGLKKAQALKGDPIQQGEIYSTIGSLYVYVGDYSKADAVLNDSYKILSAYAPISHDMSEVLMNMGILYDAQAETGRAKSSLQRALAIEEKVVPPDAQLVFRCKVGIAFGLLDPDPRAAVVMLQDLLKNVPPGTTEEALSDIWNNLATGYITLHEYSKADPFARETLAYCEKTRPAIHPDIAGALVNLSIIQREMKSYNQAEQNLRKALAIDMAFYKPGHEETGDVKRLLANTLYLEKKYGEAVPLARQALAEESSSLGRTHPRTLHAMHLVALLDLKGGQWAEAKALFQDEITARQARKDSENLPAALIGLGDVEMAMRLYGAAEQSYRQGVSLQRASRSVDPARLAQLQRKLGEALIAEGEAAAAEPLLLDSYKVLITRPKDFPDELQLTREGLLKVHQNLKRKPEGRKRIPITRAPLIH